jgi:hypothetical protein
MRLFRYLLPLLALTAAVSDLSAQTYTANGTENPLYWRSRKPDAAYWQQDVAYKIDVRLDEEDNRLDGRERLKYTNNSPDELSVVYFHLYQNAFVKGSYLYKLQREKGIRPRLGKHEAAGEGTIVSNIQVDGTAAESELDNSILQVRLPRPMKTGESIEITMDFKTWYDNGSTRRRMQMYDAWGQKHYNGCQWFPKLAVYDRKFGWDTYQHLNKEFYGDFGSFEVALDFPSNYVMEATGVLQNREEALPEELRKRLDIKNFATKKWNEAPSVITPYVKGQRKTWKYFAQGVHDFAFTADPSYRIGSTTWNGIECVAIAQEPHASGWQTGAAYVAKIIRTFSEDIGPYGYPKMVAADANDGMEYPMLTLDGGSEPGYHGLLVHEIGHNWFYGMVGSNETYRAAMDEGFTQFLTSWGLRKIDGDTIKPGRATPKWTGKWAEPTLVMDRNVLNAYQLDALQHSELPLATHSNDFHDALAHEGGYRQVYFKTASMLYNLQYVLGDSLFQKTLANYFMQWRYAHPYFEDFRASVIHFTKVDLNWFFDEWIETTKTIDYSIQNAAPLKDKKDGWAITFKREGLSQMPLDFTVTSKNGTQQSYTIPNGWFNKAGTTNLKKWWGWSKIQPDYTAEVVVPGGLKYVQIDTSYRLADVDLTNNYYKQGLFTKDQGMIARFDAGLARPVDRRHYRQWIRPDLWWNGVDGVKAGVHMEGSYLGVLRNVDASIWFNSQLGQLDRFKPVGEQKRYDRYSPVSAVLNVSTPFTKRLPKLNAELNARLLDGLRYLRAGGRYQYSAQSSIGLHYLNMNRERPESFDYLVVPGEWSGTGARPNSSINLSWNTAYNVRKLSGNMQFLLRTPFLGRTGPDAFDYSFVQLQSVNTVQLRKIEIRTRVFARYGNGNRLPSESLVFAGGANPEELMDNKYTRSVGFVPDDADWTGISDNRPVHFQQGGGINLRGYSGYFITDSRDGEAMTGYKSRSGLGANLELDIDGLFNFRPKATRAWLHIDAYLFADAGIVELSRFNALNVRDLIPTTMWSDLRIDAGPGVAMTIKRFGPFAQAQPLTLRADFPVFLNRPPFGNPNYWDFRFVVGVSRSF